MMVIVLFGLYTRMWWRCCKEERRPRLVATDVIRSLTNKSLPDVLAVTNFTCN